MEPITEARLAAGRRIWQPTRYLVGGLRTALPALVCWPLIPLVLLVSLGLPILPSAVAGLRVLSDVERNRAAAVLGAPIRSPYSPARTDLFRHTVDLLRARRTWREIGWLVVHGFLGLILPLLAVMFCLEAVVALTAPLWWWIPPRGTVGIIVQLTNWPEAIAMSMLASVGSVALLYGLALPTARFQAWYAKVLLGPAQTDLAARVEELTETRAAALEAHGAELRRIERDLHDGTQAQLVAVALRLGLAARRFDTDPGGARDLCLQARDGVEEALADLRTVIRGIYPPILSDRGLVGAIRSLAASRPVPVAVDIADEGRRCPAAVEAAAYFVVAEALTNVAKHSGASSARVWLRHQGPYLKIVVTDDGRGGANPAGGSGLAGVRRRVAALDGVTRVVSPVGAGTSLEVDLPCGL